MKQKIKQLTILTEQDRQIAYCSVPISKKDYLIGVNKYYANDDSPEYYTTDLIVDIKTYEDDIGVTTSFTTHQIHWSRSEPDLMVVPNIKSIYMYLPKEEVRVKSIELASKYKPWVNPYSNFRDYIEHTTGLSLELEGYELITGFRSCVFYKERQPRIVIELIRSVRGDVFVAADLEYRATYYASSLAEVLAKSNLLN